ncbi:MAG: OsmC family protein [Actinobacteria bacterium]|nr:OsmC family protein [Actinomycetota bacterium]
MTTTSSLNQVDLEAVGALAGKVQQDPAAGQTRWAANVHWTGAFRSESQVRSFPPAASDEPAGLGGSDTAPNPVEQLLSALGNCLAVGYAANATAAGIEIKDLDIAVDGDVDLRSFLGLAPGHAGFSAIRVRVDLDTDAAPEAVAQLHRKVAASSPVGHTLQAAVPVEITPGS